MRWVRAVATATGSGPDDTPKQKARHIVHGAFCCRLRWLFQHASGVIHGAPRIHSDTSHLHKQVHVVVTKTLEGIKREAVTVGREVNKWLTRN